MLRREKLTFQKFGLGLLVHVRAQGLRIEDILICQIVPIIG